MDTADYLYKSKIYQAVSNYRISKRNIKATNKLISSHITRQQADEVKAYYGSYVKVSTVFHDYYNEKKGKFDVRYIPDDVYFCHIDKFYNNWRAAPVIDNKCLYKALFPDVNQPELFAYRVNGFWFSGDNERINQEKLLKEVAHQEELVVKEATGSAGGRGVSFVNNIDGDIAEAFKKCVAGIIGDIVVQIPIKQHAILNNLNPGSVNTIRILTLLRENDVKICSIVLRVGSGKSRIDNLSSGGFCCGVYPNGRVKERAYTKSGETVTVHPETGTIFGELTIPNVDKALKIVSDIHPRIPHFRLVSWDVAIGEDGEPILVEANLRFGGVRVHQLANGPVFGDDTKNILDEVFQKTKSE